MAIAVSEKWHKAIEAQFRRQGYLQVVLEIVPPGIAAIEQLESDQSGRIVEAKELLATIAPPEYGIATFEKDYWSADGNRYLYDDTEHLNNLGILWHSRYPSSEEPVVFNLRFGETVSLPGLTFRWDTLNNLWPSIIIVETFLNGSKQFGGSYTVDSVNSSITDHLDNIDQIKITIPIGAWPNPDWRVRVSSITPGLLVEIDPNINMYAQETEVVSATGETLPSSTAQLSLRNIVASIGGSTLMKLVQSNDSNRYQPILGALDDDFNYNSSDPYIRVASLEERYWGATGEWVLLSEQLELNPKVGWASFALYDSQKRIVGKTFNDLNPIMLRFKLDGVSNLEILRIVWDRATGSYPTIWECITYDVFGNPVNTKRILNSSQKDIDQKIEMTSEYCSEFEIIIYRWSQEGWRARIDHLEIGSSWDYGESATEVNDFFDPMLKRGFSKYLAQRQKAFWRWGFVVDHLGTVEWLPQEMKYLDGWELPADAITATFKFTDRIQLMNTMYRQGQIPPVGGISLYDMAVRVIMNSSIVTESHTSHPYKIAPILRTLYTSAPEPVVRENVVLQYIAGAAGCILRVDPITQAIVIAEDASATQYTIGRRQQLQNPSVKLSTELKTLNVNIYSYSVEDPDENGNIHLNEAFNGTVTIKGRQTITINFNNNMLLTEVEYEVSGVPVHSIEFYIGCAVIDLGYAGSDAETEVTILIKGRNYNRSYTTFRFYHNDDIKDGNVVTINNPLITNIDVAKHCAERLLPWYLNRHTLKFEYLGYPELKAADTAAIYSKYSNSIGFISGSTLTFNGGWGGSLTTELDIGKVEL